MGATMAAIRVPWERWWWWWPLAEPELAGREEAVVVGGDEPVTCEYGGEVLCRRNRGGRARRQTY